jgi:methylthioribose-1-phosphate isomerase
MNIGGKHYRSIWPDNEDHSLIWVIDQRKLPFSLDFLALRNVTDVCNAITSMAVRGAPLIGAAAAWGIALSAKAHPAESYQLSEIRKDALKLKATRPTAINLAWAVDKMMTIVEQHAGEPTLNQEVRQAAVNLCDDEVECCRRTGMNGLPLIEEISRKKNGTPVNILTHCNAGWLATIDYGTALAPVYMAHDKGIAVHVWVDETRPRNQGARLTAFELGNHGVPFTIIPDNTGGHLMQHGQVDIVILGCDRATMNGDVANKIGTYLKALAAFDNNVPFYSAFPVSSFDPSLDDMWNIPVEERDTSEVFFMEGIGPNGITIVQICPENAPVANYGFDVTPARLITGLITDLGICRPERNEIKKLLSQNNIWKE